MMSLLKYLDSNPPRYTPHLFYGCKDLSHIPHKDYLFSLSKNKKLHLHISFSRIQENNAKPEDFASMKEMGIDMAFDGYVDKLILSDKYRELIKNHALLPQGNPESAYLYICGRTGFSKTIIGALETLLPNDHKCSSKMIIDRLISEKRLQSDLFTEHISRQRNTDNSIKYIPVSDVIEHNNPEKGYWMVISGIVYDLTDYISRHPGGAKIMTASCGMDATRAYQNAGHHMWPSIEAVLKGYQIGLVETFDFSTIIEPCLIDKKVVLVSRKGLYDDWVKAAYKLIEMQNTLYNCYSIPYQSSDTNCKIIYDIHKLIVEEFLPDFLENQIKPLMNSVAALYEKDKPINEIHCSIDKIIKSIVKPARSLKDISSQENNYLNVTDTITLTDNLFFASAKLALYKGLKVLELDQSPSDLMELMNLLCDEFIQYISKITSLYKTK